MKVTLLLENNSMFASYLNSEHGFSAWIEDEDIKVLYDFGFSDNFIKNAEALDIDLRTADYVVLSHGHRDHGCGLKYLLKYYRDTAMARKPIMLVTMEDIFYKKYNFKKNHSSGFDVDRDILEQYFDLRITPEPLWVTKNLCYMGVTEKTNDFEHKVPQVARRLVNGEWVDDVVDEDTQFAYRHKNGKEVSVVAGCAHYGICNIMEYAKKLTGTQQVHTYLGGSHLRIDEVPQSQVDKTVEYVKQQNIKDFYICHDTDLHCKLALWNATPSKEAGTGLVVELD
ncbi:MAG: MBL fold metallo-hydrolase [Chloroflexi bacterium]|nr:MBL fold metallo-hydrolase [Chloroflexota bacterium]